MAVPKAGEQPDTFNTTYGDDRRPQYTYISIEGVSIYQDIVDKLTRIWWEHLAKNQTKRRYYEGDNTLKDLGISIPPELKDMEAVVGWPRKAVEALSVRSRFDGFACDDEATQTILDEIVETSRLKRKYRQGVNSELLYGFEAITVSKGNEDDWEPPVIISLHSPETCAVIYDERRECVSAALTFVEFNDEGEPMEANLYLPKMIVHLTRIPGTTGWIEEEHPHEIERPLVDVMVYAPTDMKPLGQSRITKAVRFYTDCAVRESIRGEVSQEFSTAPQKYLLGGDSDAETFKLKTKWDAYIGSIFTASRDSEGELPQFGQLSQGSIQNHIQYMRMLATRFSGETNIPVSSLGIVQDNPSSADAIYASTEPLIIDAEDLNESNRLTLQRIARMALATYLGTTIAKLDPKQKDIVAVFKDAAHPSIVSMADAMVKATSPEGAQWIASTDVYLEKMGFDEVTRRRMQAQRRQAEARQRIEFVEDDGGDAQ